MSVLATATTVETRATPMRALPMLAIGLFGGFALGVIARAWMRLISEDPEFSWSGTVFIIGGFTIFGLAQSVVAIARRRPRRRWKLTIVRVIGAIAMLPLFAGAGALMLPTVVGGGLASTRTRWHPIIRLVVLVVAALPVVVVGSELVGSFGWSLRTAAGFVLMLAVYATIVWAAKFTMSPQLDGWRPNPWLMVILPLGVGLLLVAMIIGG